MEQRRFGDSDLVCSALGFGTWEMSTTMYGHIDVQEATRAVRSAIDHGITLFDTAEVSDGRLGRAAVRPEWPPFRLRYIPQAGHSARTGVVSRERMALFVLFMTFLPIYLYLAYTLPKGVSGP